ncbi:hypothetical protein [Paraferrimonas sedimenticola]|uniref:Uncharacterized protein n=1 Tax=Paraferrimonas sedimenticola TaxID=375674 RepID=A0AA37RTA0_9GAMM|nr:hypothetical protein [Paraferrimonas sedimenticola]GLP95490.1 hypothetical protein GCM10007895_07960 [Paraferrimonas sedimenticola]
MSFNYKNTWIQLLIGVGVLGYYWWSLAQAQANGSLSDTLLTGLLVQLVVIYVGLQIVLVVAAAVLNPKDAERGDDEHDKLFNLYGDQAAYHALAALVTVCMILVWSDTQLGLPLSFDSLSTTGNLLHLLMLSFVVAEFIKHLRQLFHYHRGF